MFNIHSYLSFMSQQKIYHVSGTTCRSCEVLIERELKKISGVLHVNVSHKKSTVTMTVDDGVSLSPGRLQQVLQDHEYTFSDVKGERPAASSVLARLGAGLVAVLGLYLLLDQTGLLVFSPNVDRVTSLGSIFVIGLVAAFSSCTAVVAGFVVALAAKSAAQQTTLTFREKMTPHLQFHLGRVAGFGVFGALIGWLGQAFTLSTTLNAVLIVVLAVFMILLGVSLMDILPKGFVLPGPPKWLSHRIHDLVHSDRQGVPYILGAATFFLPCGFTQSMQLFAMSTGDPLLSALVMMTFALGTLPPLLGLSYGALRLKGNGLTWFTRAAGVFVVVLGIANVTNGAAVLGVTPTGITSTEPSSAIEMRDGKQVIRMDVTPYGYYEPDVLTVVVDVPVRWEVTGADFMGCADTLVMRAFGVNTTLEEGLNVIEFTPTKTGTFTFSCSMGMVRGTMQVIENNEYEKNSISD